MIVLNVLKIQNYFGTKQLIISILSIAAILYSIDAVVNNDTLVFFEPAVCFKII